MPQTLLLVGFGPGISTAVAERFGAEGFSVALVARNAERLGAGVGALRARGVTAEAFPADASDPDAIRAAVVLARAALGPITVIHWNAYNNAQAGDLLAADAGDLRAVFDVAVTGLLAAVQAALPDLKLTPRGAILVTNGAYGDDTPQMDAMATILKASGLAFANAAKRKVVGLLAQRLKAEGVYVGEVTVAGVVKGAASGGGPGIESARVAETFWSLYQARDEVRARVS